MHIRCYEATDIDAVIELWHLCELTRAWNHPAKDIARKVAMGDSLFLVGVEGNEVAGTAMAGYEGHRGWVNYLAVHPNYQRSGLARQLMDEAERRLTALGCPKINLQIRATNLEAIGFYENIGYSTDDVVSMGKRLIHDA